MNSESGSVFRTFLHRLAHELEQDVDRLSRFLPSKRDGKVRMLAYAGHRNSSELRVTGRIVRYAEALDPRESMISRIRAMLALYNSHEVPGVVVRLEHQGLSAETRSDQEVYFSLVLPLPRPLLLLRLRASRASKNS